MQQRQPNEHDFARAFLALPEAERQAVVAYVYARTCIKGCEPENMTPAELMAFLTGERRELDAA